MRPRPKCWKKNWLNINPRSIGEKKNDLLNHFKKAG